jgi:hypothetical protein
MQLQLMRFTIVAFTCLMSSALARQGRDLANQKPVNIEKWEGAFFNRNEAVFY